MLPSKQIGVTIGLLLLCSSSSFVAAVELNSNISTLDAATALEQFESQLSCYHCQGGDDCVDPDAHECTVVNENDQCFILSNEDHNDIDQMGCRSDFESEDEVKELIKQKLLYLCDGVNCNGYESFPITNDCSKCSSESNELCATNPKLVTIREKCSIYPYTKCYERVSKETGATTRGCLFQLESEDFYECLTNADAHCNVCEGDGCNEEIIPADRAQCQRCNSNSDANCHSKPAALSVCPVYNAQDSCVSIFDKGVTTRGCLSEITCDVNSNNCQICKGTGCNTQNLKKSSEEIYGIFQDLPLNCNTCSGAECLTGLRNPHKCEGILEQDCMTVFDEEGEVVRRGCQSLVEADYEVYCDEHPELCFNCKSNGCNTVSDAKAFQECLYCNAATSADCVSNPSAVTTTRKCTEGCVTSLYPRKGNEEVLDLVRTCFEDIETDDREECAGETNCVQCAASECNANILPEDKERLSCLHCSKDDCDSPVAKKCSGYAENDQCYIYINNATHDAVAMGCKSEYRNADIMADIKQFFICDGDNCNTYENLPHERDCYTCDSAIDENCAIDPTKISASNKCQIPYTDCYLRVRSDGHTERGCLHDLSIENFLNCQDSNDANCNICSDSYCNQAVYPADRQMCYRCTSLDSAKCEASPDVSQYCPLYNKDDGCVTKIMDGVTHRGCSSELSCDDSDHHLCRSCANNNCNSINLMDSIGDPGKFQQLPLNCYHCNGLEECGGSSWGKINRCDGNDLQTCTVAFDADGSVAARGCSDLLSAVCNVDGHNCYDCKSNGCNVAREETAFIDCIFCDASENDACTFDVNAIMRTRQCHKTCITALYPRTNDPNPVYELTRTCLDDMDLDDRELCESGGNMNCKACSVDNCNKDDVGERKSCYHCAGENCMEPIAATCRAYQEHEQCFIQYDEANTIVEMGCKSSYDPPEVTTLLRAKRLWLCDDNDCNTVANLPAEQHCSICNSRTDPLCAIAPAGVAADTTCASTPFTQCYSRILDGGHTERGCLSSLEGDDFVNCLQHTNINECQSCAGDYCNKEIHPKERLACQICSSDTTESCESNPQTSQICLRYAADQQCVALLTEHGVTVRGCSNEVTCDGNTNCEVCSDSDCNSSNLKRKSDANPGMWQALPLTCHRCDSLIDCQAATSADVCEGHEYCMTVFNEDRAVVQRGCSNAVEAAQGSYCDMNPEHCHNCNSNECNSATSLDDYIECIYCDSKTSNDCVNNAAATHNRRHCHKSCMTALYPRDAESSVYNLTRSCLDDMDMADQLACEAGSNENCKACTATNCNLDLLPEKRLSCWACVGEDCVDPMAVECQSYKEHDQCFLLFDDQSSVVQMGCASDLSDAFIADNQHLLLMCADGDNCNGFEKIPSPRSCAICSSTDDSSCAVEPLNIPMVAQCASLPNTQCFTRVNNADGSTQRGCVSSLSKTQMLSCLSGDDAHCTTCLGDRCNIEVFPADRRSCHRCNTKQDASCESSPQAAAICPIYSTEEFCAVKLVNGNTYRGCSSEFQCDISDPEYCRHCSGDDNCNTADLISGSIGYPGQWQELPLECYTCSNEQCNDGGLGVLQKCENNDFQTCGTVFAIDGTPIQRGCSDIVKNGDFSEHCQTNSDHCKFCKSNGCNIATALNDFIDCWFCDGSVDTDCVLNVAGLMRTRSCNKHCMVGLYPRSTEVNPAYILSRGCLDDMDLNDRETCVSGEHPYCTSCDGALCNTAAIPEERRKCYVCEGSNCASPTSQTCTAFREADQCFTLFNEENSVQSKGCASDLETSYIEENSRHLLLCDLDDCNDNEHVPVGNSCATCNSLTNPACATKPDEGLNFVVCEDFPNSCYTHVDAAGVTHRGCLADLSGSLFENCNSGNSNTCTVCDSNNCNTEIYPANRRSCNRCHSATSSSCENEPLSYSTICPIFEENDSCITVIDGDHTLRGCTSEFTCDASQNDICRICPDDNCNIVNLQAGYIGQPGKWQELPLACYDCEGDECATGLGELLTCEGNNLQTCTTVFGGDADNAVLSRGCSDVVSAKHADYCEQNPEHCFGCKSNGCNNAASTSEYVDCYFCDSASSKTCSINFDSATTRTRKCQGGCMVGLYPRTSSNDPAYEMSRSCLNDMEAADQMACKAGDNDYCHYCENSNCNTMDLPEERHECYKCAGEDCEDAVIQQCSAFHPNDQCYIMFDYESSITAMGCRSELEIDVVIELTKLKTLLVCNEKNCNSFASVPTAKMCSVCNSETDPRCATNPNLVANSERCSALPYTDCYTHVNSETHHTERGCLSSLESETFYSCLMNTNQLCEICSGNNCNEIDVFPADRMRCHQCNSATDPTCSNAPNSNKVCPMYMEDDTCITNLRNGITTRGCASSTKCDNPNDKRNCRECSTPGCNTANLESVSEDGEPGIWQDLPLNCYTCKDENGENNCGLGRVEMCTINPFQNCMTIFNADGKVVQRGCSDAVEADNEAYCDSNAENCPRCNSNGCNLATTLDDYVECLACDSNTNADCVNNPDAISKTRKCHKQCMTAMYMREKEDNPAYVLSRSCLDDMDLDDREECAAGSKEFCQVCSDAKCNKDTMPAMRLSCNVCSGDGCQEPVAQACQSYRSADKCYIQYDEGHELVGMGCRSDFSNSEADYLLQQKRLFLCAGDNCNTFDATPAAQTCALCNSRTDLDCAIQPENVVSTTSCSQAPFTECYSRVLSDGATERGCLSSLYDDEFMSCLNGTSSTCLHCKGDLCNQEVYPSERFSCHICDSSVDASCASKPNSLSICPKYAQPETCVTSYVNDVTYRGCGSSLTCDETSSNACVKCSESGCNTNDLAQTQDDNFGMWQDLPLQCWTCSGADCDAMETTVVATCDNNNEQDCVTVFDANGDVIQRGCSDAVQAANGDWCSQSDENCYNCKSNECNSATSRSYFIDCIYCSTHKDLNCLWNPLSETHKKRKCQGGCMTALYAADSSSSPAYELIRTCLSDKEAADQTICANGNDANCNACTEAHCNVVAMPEDRLQCHSCYGDNCDEPVSMLCPLYKKDDKCFIWFDETNSVSEMGCISSFRNQELENIIKTKRVLVCDGKDCNTFDKIQDVQKCAACDSKDNTLCATNAYEVGTFKTCNMLPYTSCYSHLTSDGSTVRGCLSDLPGDNFAACLLGNDEKCDICTGDACNREIFPADRMQCYTCTSDDDPNCESYPTKTMACPVVNDSEACTSALSINTTVRGCSSETYCDATDKSTCRSCKGTACNSIDLLNKVDDGYHGVWQSLPLRCHTCEGEHCHMSLGPAVECSADHVEQDCMTVFDADGEVKRRGCSDDVEDYEDLWCRENPGHCFSCKSNECNYAWSHDDYIDCVFCNSSSDALCAVNAENAGFASRACYKECMVAMHGSDLIRSCLDDKELYVQHVCRTNESGKECASCDSNNCNNFHYPADRKRCHVCTGSACTNSMAQYCNPYDENDFCFAKYEGDAVELLGCASSQNASDIADWTAQNKLYRCDDDECNALNRLPAPSTCVACDSSKTLNCAQNPALVTTTETCGPLRSECLTWLNADGDTLRGCANILTEAEQSACVGAGTCAVCSAGQCNVEIFPANRRKCYICNSAGGSTCATTPANPLVCPTYVSGDRCVTKRTDDFYERGCASDVACDANDKERCEICDSDNCNTADLTGAAGIATGSIVLTLLLAFVAILGHSMN